MTTKKVFSSPDAAPVVIHAKQNADEQIAYPILVGSDGGLLVASGLSPAKFDSIGIVYSGSNIAVVSYGSLGSLVATLTISYSGSTSNIVSVVRT